MKNLRTLNVSALAIPPSSYKVSGILNFCVDSLNGTFYVLDGNNIHAIDDLFELRVSCIDSLPTSSEVVLCDFLSDECQICIAYRSGELVVVDVIGETFQEVGVLPGPICGGAWSPDQQLLIVATDEELIALTRDFDVCQRELLRPAHRGKDELLTVGWGSRETQFQGSAGRKNREKLDVNKIPVPASASDDGRVLIDWRADGQFFAVSTLDKVENRPQIATAVTIEESGHVETVNCRQVRIWDRDVELMSKCEFLAGMEAGLSVRPVGNLIAVTQLLEVQRSVRFFERNGQFRGKFSLARGTSQRVRSIGWNSNATIFAVHLALDSGAPERIQFWTVSNYDWALKLQYDFDETLDAVFWDPENSARLHTFANGVERTYRRLDLYFAYCFDSGIALSFNGDRLRLTNLTIASVPPPLSHNIVSLPSPPSEYAISSDCRLATIGCNRRTVSIYNIANVFEPVLEFSFDIKTDENIFALFNLQWKSSNRLSAVSGHSIKSNVFQIVEIDMDGNVSVVAPSLETQKCIYWHKFNVRNSVYDILYDDGVCVSVDEKTGMECAQRKFPPGTSFCRHVPELDCLLLLTKNHQLCLGDGSCTYAGVSSFSIAGEFMLVTTFSNLLFTINLNELDEFRKTNSQAANLFSTFFHDGRQLERGSVLVGHEALGTKVWLQMPRGNLETIHPRSLVVHKLKCTIDTLKFGEAIVEMRRQRIDTNLLFDHCPELFLDNVSLFLKQIQSADHLNLFVTTLRAEDTRCGMFSAYYRSLQPVDELNILKDIAGVRREKTISVGEVCARIRQQIQVLLDVENTTKLSAEELIIAVLSCYFMERKISDGLVYLKSQMNKGCRDPSDFFRKSVNYLTVLVNEQDLFQYALQTYELDLAVDILNHSNRDPKEILPILNDFKSFQPAEYRRYHVDVYLKNFSSALRHIAPIATENDERFAECILLVEREKLYALALYLFYDTVRRKEICNLCGKFALKQQFYNEAGYLFYMAGEMVTALDAFVLAQNIRNCRFLYDSILIDMATFKKAALKLEQQFAAQRKYNYRLEVLRLLDMPVMASSLARELLNCCIDAYEWDSAFNYATIITISKQGDGMTLLRLRLTERVAALTQQLDRFTRDLQHYSARLEVVRAIKLRQLREWIEQDTLGEGGIAFDGLTQSETLSETSSVSSALSHISQLSKISTATSRKRKQIERKKKQVKEGSHYEDAALLTALKEIYKAIDLLQDELPVLCSALLAVGMLGEGRSLQSCVSAVFNLANSLRPKIWLPYLEAHHLPGPLVETYRCADGIVRPPAEGLMPLKFQIEEEMVAPELRNKSKEWRLLMLEPLK